MDYDKPMILNLPETSTHMAQLQRNSYWYHCHRFGKMLIILSNYDNNFCFVPRNKIHKLMKREYWEDEMRQTKLSGFYNFI